MKILLVYPDPCPAMEDWQGSYSQAVGYILACIRSCGHTAQLYHFITVPSRDQFLADVRAAAPDAIAFSATTQMYGYCQTMARWLADDPALGKLERLIGGIHPTLAFEGVQADGLFDIVCCGEGEFPIQDYCRLRSEGKSVAGVLNFWGRENGREFRNPRRPLIADLDVLPFPAREDFDYLSLHHERKGAAAVMAGRGCPFECRYCCNHAMKGLAKGLGRYTRFRSVGHVLRELRQILDTYPSIQRFAFEDDILSLYPKWFEEFCDRYPKNIGKPYSANLHPMLATVETADALVKSGCVRVNVGLESGNDRVRREILGRKLNTQDFVASMKRLREAGLTLCANNILGIPTETMREMLDTVKLNALIGSTIHQVFIFYPFEKTKLHEYCKEQGLLTGKTHHDFMTDSILKMPPILKRRVFFMRDHFYRLVKVYRRFLGWGVAGRLCAKALDTVLIWTPTFRLIYPHGVRFVRGLKRLLGRAPQEEAGTSTKAPSA